MEFQDVALAVAQDRLPVVQGANALETAEANEGRPIPVATYRTQGFCVVLLITSQGDGDWRSDVVPVRGGDVEASGGGSGGGVRRPSDVEPGSPFVEGEGVLPLDNEKVLLQIDGVSADPRVRLRHGAEVVAQADVAAHGYFVLAAVLPTDAKVVVEAA